MRPIEIMTLLAILFSLLAYLVPRSRRPRWLSLLPALPALLVALHLLVEGYRWQMVPAYALAVVVVAAMIRGARRTPNARGQTPSRRGRIVAVMGTLLGLLLLVPAAALPAVLPVFSLPEPTGPHAVGTRYDYWSDESRPDEATADPGDFRNVSVQIWYPAELGGDEKPIRYMRREAARAFARFQGLPEFLLDHFELVRTHATLGTDVAETGEPFPVITYSTSGLMSWHMTLFEELASHGYVVVCIGHPYWNPFVYGSQGEAIPFDGHNAGYEAWWEEANSSAVLQAMANVTEARTIAAQERAFATLNQLMPLALSDLRVWAGDIGFVLDELEVVNQSDALLAGSLNLERVGIMGFSKGGAAAGQFCVTDGRCTAGINLTGFMYGDIVTLNLDMPFFFMTEEELWCPDCDANDLFYKRAEGNAYQMKIRGARHTNFGDATLYGWLMQQGNEASGIESDRVIRIQNAFSLAFFDRYLKGGESPLLADPSTAYPEVVLRSRGDSP